LINAATVDVGEDRFGCRQVSMDVGYDGDAHRVLLRQCLRV
jgi:hypothetical protein